MIGSARLGRHQVSPLHAIHCSLWLIFRTFRFLPRVAARDQSPAKSRFLHKLLESIYARRHKPTFANVKEMFQTIIKNSGARLRLSPLAFEPRGPYYDWNHRIHGNKHQGEEFLDFIERCCSAGASNELDRVIK
jgi:hypothetical protein